MLAINTRQFWAVFFTKLVFNLRSEVSRTYLGYVWWLLEPVLFVTALYIVFGTFLRTRTEDFLVFLVIGQVSFSWFSRSVSNASRAMLGNKGLMNQVAIQKLFFPLLVVCQDLVKQAVVFVAMLGFLLYMGVDAGAVWLTLPLIMMVQLLLILAVGFVCAGIVPLVPDFRFLIGTMLTITMWGSGVFYSYEDVLLERHQNLFLMNPMANLIKNYRQVLLDGVQPDWSALAVIALISIGVILAMMWVFRRLDTTFARLALQ